MPLLDNYLVNTLGYLSRSNFLAAYPHNALPGQNMNFDLESELSVNGDFVGSAANFFKSFPFIVSYPVPIFPPIKLTRSELNGLDPCIELVNRKRDWNHVKTTLLNRCKKSMVSKFKNKKELAKLERCKVHPRVAALIDHLKKDPDPYLNSVYNWYFTGGNIEIATIEDRTYLVKPNGPNRQLLFSPLTYVKGKWLPDLSEHEKLSFDLKESKIPYQVDTFGNIVLVRERNHCSYLMLTENDGEIVVEDLFSIEATNNCPFMSVNINKENTNEFCTLSPDKELIIWNASVSRSVSKFNLNFNENYKQDCWGFAYYIGVDTLIYTDRQKVNIFDTRVNNNGKSCAEWHIDQLADICEEISCCNIGDRNINYIGTSHHLLSLDIREGWLQRWTHAITTPPSILKILHHKSDELIFLGSQRSDSVVLIENNFENSDYGISRVHPYALPSLRESLHLARCNGLCLDHVVTPRFTMSNTGLCCIKGKYPNIIRCTSVGDIFLQTLKHSKIKNKEKVNEFSNDNIEKIREFEIQCEDDYNNTEIKCETSFIKNTQDLIDYLYCSPINNYEKPLINVKLPTCKQLKKYCDYLAPKLLKVWNIDEMSEGSEFESERSGEVDDKIDVKNVQEIQEEEEEAEEEYDVQEAVMNWLDTYSQEMAKNVEYNINVEDIPVENEDLELNECKGVDNVNKLEKPSEIQILDELEPMETGQNNLETDEDEVKLKVDHLQNKSFINPTKNYVAGF